MKIIKTSAFCLALIATAVVGFGATGTVKAESQWIPEVIASSSLVRFEVQPTAYDAVTNKYKYKFSWLMPRYRTYSFLIDGKMYNARVTQNGVVETPFWFSPDITYSIQIFPYANARGAMVAEGKFLAPSVAPQTPPAPVLTLEEEYLVVAEYIANAPKLPIGKVTSKQDEAAILLMMAQTRNNNTTAALLPYLSAKSVEMFSKTPLVVAEIDQAALSSPDDTDAVLKGKIKILKGKEYALLKYKTKNTDTGKMENAELVLVKENNQWKVDMIQTLKSALYNF